MDRRSLVGGTDVRCVRNVVVTRNVSRVSVIIQNQARTRVSAALERSAGGDPASDVSGFSLTSLNAFAVSQDGIER